MDVEHLILTRFAVRPTPEAPPHLDEWLDYRLALFAAYCLPGLANQTREAFRWLVFCDESTAPWCLDRLRAMARDVPQMRVALTSATTSAVDRLRAGLRAEDAVVTTRVDSDDASSTDLVERIAAYVDPFCGSDLDSLLLNFSRGYKLETASGRVFETFHPQSPHLTLFERVTPGRPVTTVQSGNHGFMSERHVLHSDVGPPAWVQLVHGGNLSNHVHETDSEVEPEELAERFVLDGEAAARAAAIPEPPQPEGAAERASFRQALEDALLPRARSASSAP